MKTVTKYIAEGGKEFSSQEECKKYEQNKWFVDIWEEVFWFEHADIYSGRDVLEFLSKHCIITKKPEAISAKKVLNKGKNN